MSTLIECNREIKLLIPYVLKNALLNYLHCDWNNLTLKPYFRVSVEHLKQCPIESDFLKMNANHKYLQSYFVSG